MHLRALETVVHDIDIGLEERPGHDVRFKGERVALDTSESVRIKDAVFVESILETSLGERRGCTVVDCIRSIERMENARAVQIGPNGSRLNNLMRTG